MQKIFANSKKYSLLIIAGLLLIAQLILQLNLAKLDAQTTDEGDHLAAGYTYVTTGDWRFNPEHPPLTKVLAGLAILPLHPHITSQMTALYNQSDNYFYDSWQQEREYGEMLLYQSGNNPEQLLFWGRLPFVIITFLLGLTILLIAWREWGQLAGLGAVAIYALDPNINAHGHLINTDIPVALGYLLTIYTVWKFFHSPSWWWAVTAGASVGLALLLKHTAIIIFPAIFILFVFYWIISKDWGFWKKVLPKMAVGLLVAWVVIWAGFGFHDRLAPATVSWSTEYTYTGSHNGSLAGYIAPSPSKSDKEYTLVRPLLDLLPGDYVKGVWMVLNHVGEGSGSAFLLGKVSPTGWWYYFPVVMFFKTPIPSLILFALAIYLMLRKRPIDWLPVGLTTGAGVFLLFALTSKADLGIRHVLPVYPLLFVVVGYAIATFKKWRFLYIVLFAWLAIIMIVSYPYYLSYFNELAGGSNNGYKITSDSNLDWGQDLKRIADYIHTNKLQNVYIDYGWDSTSALNYYLGTGDYHFLDDWQKGESGWAIINATDLDGVSRYRYLKTCPGLKQITPSVFVCQLH